MRIVILPEALLPNPYADSEFQGWLKVVRGMIELHPDLFVYFVAPKKFESDILPEQRIKMLFIDELEPFSDLEIALPLEFRKKFGTRNGEYQVDAVLTSRSSLGVTLARSLWDYRHKDDQVPVFVVESQAIDFGYTHTAVTDASLMARTLSYAATWPVFQTDWELEVAKNAARRYLNPATVMQSFKKAKVIPLWFNWERVDALTAGVKKDDQFTVFFGGRLNCLPPDTLVWTENGLVAVGDVLVGDKVLSGESAVLNQVEERFRYRHKGKLISLKSAYLEPILMTSGHFVRVASWRKRFDVVETFRSERDTLVTRTNRRIERYEPEWVSACDLMRRVKEMENRDVRSRTRYEVMLPIDQVEEDVAVLDGDTCWLIGMFAGDGNLSSKGYALQFALNRDRVEIVERIKAVASKWNANTYSRVRSDDLGKWLELTISSKALADVVGHFVRGRRSFVKELDSQIMRLPREKQQSVLAGLDDSDGCAYVARSRKGTKLHYKRFGSTSRKLALQYQMLCLRLDIVVGISNSQPVRGLSSRRMWRVRQSGKPRDGRIQNGVFFAVVKDIREVEYDGDVVDLSVCQARSYITQSGLVHNSAKRGNELLQIMDAFYKFGRPVKVVVCSPREETRQLPKWREQYPYFEFYTNLSSQAFYKKAASAHVYLNTSKIEGFSMGFLEQLYLGLVGVFPDASWTRSLLGAETVADYPFAYTTLEEAAVMLRRVFNDYEGALVHSRGLYALIKEKYGRPELKDALYSHVKGVVDTRDLPDLPIQIVDLARRAIKRLPESFTVDELYEQISKLSLGFHDSPVRGQPSRWDVYQWLRGHGFRDLCDGPEPRFVEDAQA